jgi:hypothetical protein
MERRNVRDENEKKKKKKKRVNGSYMNKEPRKGGKAHGQSSLGLGSTNGPMQFTTGSVRVGRHYLGFSMADVEKKLNATIGKDVGKRRASDSVARKRKNRDGMGLGKISSQSNSIGKRKKGDEVDGGKEEGQIKRGQINERPKKM